MNRHAADLAALRRLAQDDLSKASDEELREQAREEGMDFEALGDAVRGTMREAAASVIRQSHSRRQVTSRSVAQKTASTTNRPSIQRIKELIAQLAAREPRLSMAFRDGSTQSDRDLEFLYDDLVRMGALKRDDDDSH